MLYYLVSSIINAFFIILIVDFVLMGFFSFRFYVKSKNSIGESIASMTVNGTPNASVEYNQFLDGLNTEIERELGKDNIESAFRNSIVNMGNNYRFKTALDKAKNGEDVTFAYIGGSITVGEGASQRTTEGFTKGYASYTNDFVNEYYAKKCMFCRGGKG